MIFSFFFSKKQRKTKNKNGNGRPWQQQYELFNNDIKLCNWEINYSLPYPLAGHKVLQTKNKLYILGGHRIQDNEKFVTNEIISTTVENENLGSWLEEKTGLPEALQRSVVLVYNDNVFLVGGAKEEKENYSNKIYSTTIDEEGNLSNNWRIVKELPNKLCFHEALIIKDKIYIIGGDNSKRISSYVYFANIKDDNSIGVWRKAPRLPESLSNIKAVVIKNKIYLIGGYNGDYIIRTIYVADINEEGLLNEWEEYKISLPENITNFGIWVTKKYVYIFGGFNKEYLTSAIYRASIDEEGNISNWELVGNLPTPICDTETVAVKNKIYLIGGWFYDNLDVVMSADIISSST